jgi:hypothetical protein
MISIAGDQSVVATDREWALAGQEMAAEADERAVA